MSWKGTTTGFTRRPTVEEWERMSWRARQSFVKHQKLEARARRRYKKKRFSDSQQLEGKIPQPHPMDAEVRRCGNCGGWMIDVCWTCCAS
ncbi:MAG TPA: hypothetical protein VIG24_19045 [Acidimicrobiia bacterium]